MQEISQSKILKPELLIPAGSLEVLKTAVIFGADAVYIGGEAFGLRAKAKNFSMEDIRKGIAFAHKRNVKVYVTANILAHNRDLEDVREYFEELKSTGLDALIISDPAVFLIARQVLPNVDIHISTQANNTNYGTFQFWYELGAKRVVTARELSLEEIREIRAKIPEEMECFVDRFDFTLGAQLKGVNNCGILSYKDKIYINMIRSIEEPKLEDMFFSNLSGMGIDVLIERTQKEQQ